MTTRARSAKLLTSAAKGRRPYWLSIAALEALRQPNPALTPPKSADQVPVNSLPSAAGRMALITIDAVVDISGHVGVLEIARVVVAVATRTLKHRIVTRVDVAS